MVTYCSNPQKDHPCVETSRLSHKAWKSVQRFDLGVGSRKNGRFLGSRKNGRFLGSRKKGKDRTGQDSQKSHKVTSSIWGEAPTAPIETQICMEGNLADVITCVKFQDDNFQGLQFYRGSNFPFSCWFFAWDLQQCSTTALCVISLFTVMAAQNKLYDAWNSCQNEVLWGCEVRFPTSSQLDPRKWKLI